MESLITSYKDGVRTIKFNRPERKNAMDKGMYEAMTEILNRDASDDKVVVTIITGVGEYFSSGNDIKSAMLAEGDSSAKLLPVKRMVDAFINYPKLLIAVVNGPGIGIGATMPGLCDIIYASESAVFDTPFVKLGLLAEGASSFTFPFSMGRSKASEVLYLNHKLTAKEAYQFGFISKVIPDSQLNEFIDSLHVYGKLPVNSVIRNKKAIMGCCRQTLSDCNEREIEILGECVESQEFSDAILQFLSRKSKL